MIRLAIVTSHPTQYYGPWFRHLASQPDFELRVFYLWDAGVTAKVDEKFGQAITWDTDLLSDYEHEFIRNEAKTPSTSRFQGLYNPTLRTRLKAWAPDFILLFGYAYRSHLSLLCRPPAPLLFRGDSHLLGQPSIPLLKRVLLNWIYRHFRAITYVGEANCAYFETFGTPSEKLHFVPHCVDAQHFSANESHQNHASEIRRDLGLTGKRVILFSGKFVKLKQPTELLRAFISIASPNEALVLAGDGPEKSALEEIAAQHPDVCIRFLPFANQSEMPARYLVSDLFVLPSKGNYETWGLAVNEAMHMGIPCLVSDLVGCQKDLVSDGKTGWVFKANQTDSLKDALRRALGALDQDTTELKQSIADRISGYTYAEASRRLLKALQSMGSS